MIDLYWDNAATTAPLPEIVEDLGDRARAWYGNPSSVHDAGRHSQQALETARQRTAELFGVDPEWVLFTGSGSESDNLAIKGVLQPRLNRGDPVHAITSAVEHKAVLNTFHALEKKGLELDVLDVDQSGRVDPGQVSERLRPDTALVSIMWANNEVGVIQPIPEIARKLESHSTLFHTDAVQAAGKTVIDLSRLPVDLCSISGHKFHALKGVGALLRRPGISLEIQIHGGGQEQGLRSGTENIVGVWSLGRACEWIREQDDFSGRLGGLRDRFERGLLENLPDIEVLARHRPRLPNISCIRLPGVQGGEMVEEAGRRGVAISSGSACSSGETQIPSHVLQAMERGPGESLQVVRVSFGALNRFSEIKPGVERLTSAVLALRETVRS